MVFGIDDLIMMGAAVAAREAYVRYKHKDRSPNTSTTTTWQSDPKDGLYRLLRIGKDDSRVLTLKSSVDGVVVELTKRDLHEDESNYSALSYYWGGSTHGHKITVNGIEWHVTENLYAAFVSLKNWLVVKIFASGLTICASIKEAYRGGKYM